MPIGPSRRGRIGPRADAWACVVLVCMLVYWPWLGAAGFSMTEGHRAIPGFEMVERWRAGESEAWWSPTLFGQVYVRKPPGVSWLIAMSSIVFGASEFAARVPSALAATGMGLTALWFGTRWFGRSGGLACGLAQALWPWMWSSGRAAEIEAVHNACVSLSVLVVVEVVVFGRRHAPAAPSHGRWHGVVWALVLGLAIAGAGLAKGPAGWAVIGGAMIAGGFVCGWRAVVRWSLVAAVVVPAGVWMWVYWRMSEAISASGQAPVTQGPSEFLWNHSKLTVAGFLKVAGMPIAALASALPASLALLFPWGRNARREAAGNHEEQLAFGAARVIGLACVGSLLALAVLGVDNPRYAMPSACVLPMLVGYIVRGVDERFTPVRRRIARRMLLIGGSGRSLGWWATVLTMAAVAVSLWAASRSPTRSGRMAGVELGEVIRGYGAGEAVVVADHLVEARPEVLWYADRARGTGMGIRWIPGLGAGSRPAELDAGGLVVLRTDPGSGELAEAQRNWQGAGPTAASSGGGERNPTSIGAMEAIACGSVSKFDFTLFAWRAWPAVSAAGEATGEHPAKDRP